MDHGARGHSPGEIYKIPIPVFHWHRDKAKLLAARIIEANAAHDRGADVEDSALLLRRGRDVPQPRSAALNGTAQLALAGSWLVVFTATPGWSHTP